MLARRVIPCLDVQAGRVVKGTHFRDLRDAGDPVQLAARYDAEGADELVFLDVTATLEDRPATLDVVSGTAEQVFIPLTVGGGVRSEEDGTQCMVLSLDARRSNGSWEVVVEAGTSPAGMDAVAWAIEASELGAGELLVTSIDRDGTGQGYDLPLLRAISDAVPVPVVASGGAGALEHFADALTEGRADAVLAASRFHFDEIGIRQVKAFLASRGITVRS